MPVTQFQDDQQVQDEFTQQENWGLCLSLDLKNCDPDLIRSQEHIKDYVRKLCNLIDMRRYGETTVVRFGDDPKVTGFSMTQLIETSLISGHFADQTNAAYLDIFSCKFFPPFKTAEFTKNFFNAQNMEINILFRTV